MILRSELSLAYWHDPTRHLGLERYESTLGDFNLLVGYCDMSALDRLHGERLILMEFEDPNRFCVRDPGFNRTRYDPVFETILTICPFTAEWLNRRERSQRRVPVFFPFNPEYIPPVTGKRFDVIYSGGLVAPSIEHMVRALSRFDYRLSLTTRIHW